LNPNTDPNAPPSRELLLLEVRAIWELTAFFASYPLLRLAARGDGHSVLVLPGLAASDTSTRPLRRFLADQGWASQGWQLGANRGPRPGAEAAMQERLASVFRQSGRKVSLIGWSLGGIFAREMARRAPEQVRAVITLGSPFAGDGNLQPQRRHRRVAGLPRARRSLRGEHRDRRQPLRPRPQPRGAVCDRRSAVTVGRSVEAFRSQRPARSGLPRPAAQREGRARAGRPGGRPMNDARVNSTANARPA
jgi:pimeloyl-ACP methyl ester carboxylesterase